MKLEELRLSDVTEYGKTYRKSKSGQCPRLCPLASCRIYRSASRRFPRRSICLYGSGATVMLETDDLVFDSEDLLQPGGHTFIESFVGPDFDAFAVGSVPERYHI